MSSPQDIPTISSSPHSIKLDRDGSPTRYRGSSIDNDHASHARYSPTLSRSFNPLDPDARERQRTLDEDMALHLSLARRGSISTSPVTSPHVTREREEPHPAEQEAIFPTFSLQEERELDIARGANIPNTIDEAVEAYRRTPTPEDLRLPHLSQGHDPSLLVSLNDNDVQQPDAVLPMYQATLSQDKSNFNFKLLEEFATEEKNRLGFSTSPERSAPPVRHRTWQGHATITEPTVPVEGEPNASSSTTPDFTFPLPRPARQRKLSHSTPAPRRQGGKMALFEGTANAPPLSLARATHLFASGVPHNLSTVSSEENLPATLGAPSAPAGTGTGHDRPYRFSFYSNGLSATIHARSLSELPAENQSFEDLFGGVNGNGLGGCSVPINMSTAPAANETGFNGNNTGGGTFGNGFSVNGSSKTVLNERRAAGDSEGQHTWWLDVLSPTDEEMKMLSQVFGIHPLTAEDIQMEEAREKIELFRTYYLVCFRSFDQDPFSPTYLEPLNMYIIVFREGTLSFHFRSTPHPQNVRRRIKQLKDYISVTSDWISYALIDDITDAFWAAHPKHRSDMLRRIGTCRKKVMGLLRLMGNKADVVKGLAKRCNENWKVAPTSDIGLYLSDIQDHLITMTQNLNHYEKILSRSHSNYLAQISIEMTDANNQINDVLSKLTALGTVLIPMNLVTGLWGMNVHVPGQNISGYAWFLSIIGGLVAFAIIGGYSTYKFMVRR
ncbi:hypothetical protein EW146_g3373 [Bondarzewia mesenterica]|uniref:Cora-domain-containing protein n=1 Tax=Bondarzewia mesenterica TaxID=1095465 RepID=A0A4S4LY15_9AGAM|nr:hypothetical protein EW146_g3373 [Bondarzewia mesenterica]